MSKSEHILQVDLVVFSKLLEEWSTYENSYFLRSFYRVFGMSETQFHKRYFKAKKSVVGFNAATVKKNLRRNRFQRKYIDGACEKIEVKF